MAISNNAVTTVIAEGREFVVSFAGITAGKTYREISDATFIFDAGTGRWTQAGQLPGGVGRLAATAASAGSLAYVFGGYSVAADGSEKSTPWAHSFDPIKSKFDERQGIPVPVDDSLAVAFRDRYIYLVSGWHDDANVDLVQRYDTQTDSWDEATPIPGRPVFGHAGGIVGNRIVYCDGVAIETYPDRKREFVANDECFLGVIDPDDGRRINWRRIESHPGSPRYRMAATGIELESAVLFIGGSENPYNYDGIGYDSRQARPANGALLFDVESSEWTVIRQDNEPSMDHRGLVPIGDTWATVGGMLDGQQVTRQVTAYSLKN